MADGPTTNAVFASASSVPSTLTKLMVSSERPDTPAGMTAFRLDRPSSGTAHEPGPIE